MRGKLGANLYDKVIQRITPAHAGKTPTAHQALPRESDHPRACGENLFTNFTTTYDSGSPPRMRGKRAVSPRKLRLARITPAHAGKTSGVMLNGFVKSDHPRACGENALNKARNKPAHGSPPRMRGKPLRWNGRKTLRRITPAHAGKTLRPLPGTRRTSDHPRACGENEQKHYESNVNTGSPPRMRGKRSGCRRGVGQRRITPAHAGKTDAIITIVVTNWDHPRACGENRSVSVHT